MTLASLLLCGKDPDEVFAYQTPKVVILKDRKLGLIAIILKILIFCYIFLWTILFQGKHLSVADVNGVNRLSVRNPTEDMCNPFHVGCRSNYTQFDELAYCTESPLPYPGGGNGAKRPCQIWDSTEVSHPVDNGILLPTRVRRFDQVRACEPSAENNWSCHPSPYAYVTANGSPQTTTGEATPKYDAFIADIERFTVLIDHSFKRTGGMMEDDGTMQGHVYECPRPSSHVWDCKTRAIPCLHEDCPEGSPQPHVEASKEMLLTLRGKRRFSSALGLEALENHGVAALGDGSDPGPPDFAHAASEIIEQRSGPAVALSKGDVFTVGSLLRLAHADIDVKGGFPTAFRARGLVIVVHIQYNNQLDGAFLGLHVTPWGTPHPFYTYKVSLREAADYRLTKTSNDPADAKRTIRIYNGIRVVIEQSGSIAVWDTAYFLMTMTTALGLMAVANTLTDLMLQYFLPKSEEYKKRKFHTSKDFNPDCPAQEAQAGPTTRKEAADIFLEALEAQDSEAIADALPKLLELSKKDS